MQHLTPHTRPSVIGPVGLFAASIGAFYLYILSSAFLSTSGALVLYALSQVALLGIVYLFARSDRTSLSEIGFVIHGKPLKTILIGAGLSVLFLLVTLEPGFIFGFERLPLPSPETFAFYLFVAPVIALSQEAVFRGYIMRKLALRGSFNAALFLSSFCFALFSTNLLATATLSYNTAIENVFTVTVENLILGLFLGMFFYKSSWSLLGPVVFRIGLILETSLTPLLPKVPNWEFLFTFELAGYMLAMVLVMVLVREPGASAGRYLGRVFGPKRNRLALKESRKKGYRNALVAVPLLIAVVLGSTYGVQATLGTNTPFLAIASGSMVPTLHVGDLVVLHGVTSPSQIAVGDIVAYHNVLLNETVIHRIIRVSNSTGTTLYTFKGDANKAPDPLPVKFSQIKGKLILHVPVVGYLLLSPPLVVALVVCMLFFSSLRASSEGKQRRPLWRG